MEYVSFLFAPMFEEKGLKTFNYGMSGSHLLFEADLLLKIMLEGSIKSRLYLLKLTCLSNDKERML
jgi:hypothetical protein